MYAIFLSEILPQMFFLEFSKKIVTVMFQNKVQNILFTLVFSLLFLYSCDPTPWNLKAIIQTCSVKKAFLEISQNSQVLSCEFCEFSKNTFFDRTPQVATSRNHWNPIEINSFYDLTCTKWKRSRKNLGYYLGQK